MCLSAFNATELSRDGSMRLLTKPPVSVSLRAAVAGRRRERGEVASQHRRGRRVADDRRRVALFDAALVAAEHEHLVLDDRRAERAAELIAAEIVFLRREVVALDEVVVAVELERVAVNLVRSGLGHQVDRGGGVITVARRQRAGLDLELLQRIGERRRQVQAVERIVVRAAVHDVGDAVGLAAGHRDRHGRKILVGVEVAGRRGGREAGEEDQLGRLPAVERQLHDALVVDHLADAGVLGFDQRRVRGHRDLLADRADRERHVDLGVRSDLQHDAVAHVGVESLQHDLQLIGTDRQVRQRVGAVGAGEHRAHRAGVGLGGGDLGAGNRAAATNRGRRRRVASRRSPAPRRCRGSAHTRATTTSDARTSLTLYLPDGPTFLSRRDVSTLNWCKPTELPCRYRNNTRAGPGTDVTSNHLNGHVAHRHRRRRP